MPEAAARRRLAAILAADVVGYSRLMETAEAATLARLKAHRAELIDPLLADHGGRLIKLMGDGALVEFPSVVEAVECAVAIQRGMVEREAGRAEVSASASASASIWATCWSTATISTATASTSPRAWRHWPSPAAS